jgi:hypothetical protein
MASARKPIMHGTSLAANADVPLSIMDVPHAYNGDTAGLSARTVVAATNFLRQNVINLIKLLWRMQPGDLAT